MHPIPQVHPHVLIIDDDPEVRTLLQERLTREGFWVLEAASGLEALDLIASVKFDLLITDLRLKGCMGGIETVQRARILDPELRSLFISGVEDPPWDHPDYDDFVSKPFDIRQIVGCVWELLCRNGEERQR